jgi:hypothetical protein
VHVDDLLICGERKEAQELYARLGESLKLREEGRLMAEGDMLNFLGRQITATATGYRYESPRVVVEALLAQLGMAEAKSVVTPAVRENKEEQFEQLSAQQAAEYRAALGKELYIGHDHVLIQYAAGVAARRCAAPLFERCDECIVSRGS